MNNAVSMPITVISSDSKSQRDISLYLKTLYGNAPENTFIGLSLQPVGQKVLETFFFRIDDQDRVIRRIEQKRPNYNIYLRVAPLSTKPVNGRGEADLSAGSAVLWVDIDLDNVVWITAKLEQLPLPPTNVISSGHGVHAYWQLETFCTDHKAIREANRALQFEINQILQIDVADDVYDLARIMRVPGSVNLKNGSPQLVQTIQSNPERSYSIDQFSRVEVHETVNHHWDAIDLPLDFLDVIQERDRKLYARMFSEKTAVKIPTTPTTVDGNIDFSRNDAYIVTRLLGLGYSANICVTVLMHDDWLSGEKYRRTLRFGYVRKTVSKAWENYQKSPDRFFTGKTFQTKNMATDIGNEQPFIFTAEKLYRYNAGVFRADGEKFIRNAVAKVLGDKWNSRFSNETVTWFTDTCQFPITKVVENYSKQRGLINVQNGMLDTNTNQLLPHSDTYCSMAQLPIEYDPNANTNLIDQFVAQIIPSDSISFFWEYVGSAFIQDDYWPKAFVALVGLGDSGKSALLRLLVKFYAAENITTIPFQTLADHRFASADLFGRLANIFSDLSESEAQDAGKIKNLTGDDYTWAEQKFKEPFKFKNTARLFFSANDMPAIRNPDGAYFNRAYIIPCTNHFADGVNADRDIANRLATPEHLAAVLLRAVQGLQRLLKNECFTYSETINAAKSEYRYRADTVQGFFQSGTEENANALVTKAMMYQHYKDWCAYSNRKPVNADKFFKRVTENLDRLKLTEEYHTYETERKWAYCGRRILKLEKLLMFS